MEVPKESKPWLNSSTIGFIVFFKIIQIFGIFGFFWHWVVPKKLLDMEDTQNLERQSTQHFAPVCQCASVPEMAQGVSNPIT